MEFIPKGVLPAMITPLKSDGNINEKALCKLINYLIDGGVHGIFAIGTTGEFYAITNEEYRAILEITKEEVAGRVPVYAGANHITTRGSIALAQIAEDVGVDALSVLTPMFITPNQEQIYQHFATIAANTSLPIILYNNKPKTYVDITPATVTRLADIDNIVGIKDSTGDMTNTCEYIRLTRGKKFYVMMGRDTLIHAALCYGATGAVAACANVAPRICADIYDKYLEGDLAGSLDAQYRLAPLRIAFGIGTFPAVIKEGLELLGIEAGPCYAPVGPLTDEERGKLKKILIEMGLIS
jgi:4-hydroxy-tetrahydrodipicolinate synthase